MNRPSHCAALGPQGYWRLSRTGVETRTARCTPVRFAGAVFVLHVFQKKAKSGIATPKQDIELIRERLKAAEQIVKELSK